MGSIASVYKQLDNESLLQAMTPLKSVKKRWETTRARDQVLLSLASSDTIISAWKPDLRQWKCY